MAKSRSPACSRKPTPRCCRPTHTKGASIKTFHAIAIGALLAFQLAALDASASGDTHAHAPKHGGVVVEVKHLDVELVARADSLRIHLRDHDQPLKLAGASAKVTLLTAGVKTEVALAPVGDVLEAKGSFKTADTTALVLIALPGKAPLTARFSLK